MLYPGPSTEIVPARPPTARFGLLARAQVAFIIQIATILVLAALCLSSAIHAKWAAEVSVAEADRGVTRVVWISDLIQRFRLIYSDGNSAVMSDEEWSSAGVTLSTLTMTIRQALQADAGQTASAPDALMADALGPMLDAMDTVLSARRQLDPVPSAADATIATFDGLVARALDVVAFECARLHQVRDDARAAGGRAHRDVMSILICVLLTLLACGLGLVNARQGLRRVSRIARALKRLAAGDVASQLPPPDRADEVGVMAHAAAAFRATLVELMDRRADLRELNVRLDTAVNGLEIGVCLYDRDHRLVLSNLTFQTWFNARHDVIPLGTSRVDVTRHVTRLGMHPDQTEREVAANMAALATVGRVLSERTLVDGRVVVLNAARTPDGGFLVTYEDVSESRRSEQRVAYLAQHDPLTGLANRTLFRERLASLLSGGRQTNFSVLCMDIDHFAAINEQHGPDAGDVVLVGIAARLATVLREGDTLARLGADEFAIIQCQCERPEHASVLAVRVLAALEAPFAIGGQPVACGVTIGIAIAPSDGLTPEQLLRAADLALVRAKSGARGTWRFFEAAMDAAAQARRGLEADLREAVAAEAFDLYFQPLVSMSARRISGFEALLRWRHPERGMVSPADFIPLCEEIGLIVPLGAWVLRRACAEAMTWPDHVKVAVNLSPAQFRGRSVVDTVATILAETGLPAHRLELEITESVLLTDGEDTLAALHGLRRLGVRISMDDFGTGYSSLSYLRSFPFDKIKIDRSFIMDMDEREDSVAIVRAVAGLGSSLGITTTAEGVETQAQLDQVAAEGCDEVQGYFFSPPRPANEVAGIIRRVDAGDAHRPLAA